MAASSDMSTVVAIVRLDSIYVSNDSANSFVAQSSGNVLHACTEIDELAARAVSAKFGQLYLPNVGTS